MRPCFKRNKKQEGDEVCQKERKGKRGGGRGREWEREKKRKKALAPSQMTRVWDPHDGRRKKATSDKAVL